MSKKCVNYLIENQERLRSYNVIDDVAIGICINSDSNSGLISKKYGYKQGLKFVDSSHVETKFLCYRHRNDENRIEDEKLMQSSIDAIKSLNF